MLVRHCVTTYLIQEGILLCAPRSVVDEQHLCNGAGHVVADPPHGRRGAFGTRIWGAAQKWRGEGSEGRVTEENRQVTPDEV